VNAHGLLGEGESGVGGAPGEDLRELGGGVAGEGDDVRYPAGQGRGRGQQLAQRLVGPGEHDDQVVVAVLVQRPFQQPQGMGVLNRVRAGFAASLTSKIPPRPRLTASCTRSAVSEGRPPDRSARVTSASWPSVRTARSR